MLRGLGQFLITATILVSATSNALSKDIPAEFITSFTRVEGGADLVDKQLYLVEITCRPNKKKVGDQRLRQWFPSVVRYTASHIIVLTSSRLAALPEAGSLPADALAVTYPYSITPEKVVRDAACSDGPDRHLIAGGEKDITIHAAVNFSKESVPSPIFKVITDALKVASPLLKIFDAPEAGALANKYLGKGEAVEDPLKTLLTHLNAGKSQDMQLKLKVGKYVVKTTYGDETITVKPVNSLVTSSYKFSSYINRQIASNNITLSKTDYKSSCLGLYNNFVKLGFTAPLDRGYAIMQVALNGQFEKANIIDCLSRDDAFAVAKNLPALLWANAEPEKQRFTPEDVELLKGDPQTTKLVAPYNPGKIEKIVSTLSQEGRAWKEGENGKGNVLASYFTDEIEVDDQTSDRLFDGETSIKVDKLVPTLASKGIRRFGCFDNAQLGSNLNGDLATATFLGFKVNPDATTATQADAFVIRAFYGPKKINKIYFSKDAGKIDVILTNRTACGELKIIKPQS